MEDYIKDYERIVITINSNYKEALYGLPIVQIFDADTNEKLLEQQWVGSDIEIRVLKNRDCKVVVNDDATGYAVNKTEEEFTTIGDNTRVVEFYYDTCLIMFAPRSNQLDDTTIETSATGTVNGEPANYGDMFYFRAGEEVTVTFNDIAYYETPADVTFVAAKTADDYVAVNSIYYTCEVTVIYSSPIQLGNYDDLLNSNFTVEYFEGDKKVTKVARNGYRVKVKGDNVITVHFPEIEGYETPEDREVTIAAQAYQITVDATYNVMNPFTINFITNQETLSSSLSAECYVGVNHYTLTPGNNVVSVKANENVMVVFNDVAGLKTPDIVSFQMGLEPYSINATYLGEMVVFKILGGPHQMVTLTIDGTNYQDYGDGGSVIVIIPNGNTYICQPNDVAGYIAPYDITGVSDGTLETIEVRYSKIGEGLYGFDNMGRVWHANEFVRNEECETYGMIVRRASGDINISDDEIKSCQFITSDSIDLTQAAITPVANISEAILDKDGMANTQAIVSKFTEEQCPACWALNQPNELHNDYIGTYEQWMAILSNLDDLNKYFAEMREPLLTGKYWTSTVKTDGKTVYVADTDNKVIIEMSGTATCKLRKFKNSLECYKSNN